MRIVTITKSDYDEVVYGAISSDSPNNMKDLRIADAVLVQLEEHGTPKDEKITDSLTGQTVEVELWKMNEMSVELNLEDAHADYMHTRLLAVFPQLPVRRTRHLIPLMEALEPKK